MDHLRNGMSEADLRAERERETTKQGLREVLKELEPPRLSTEEQLKREREQSDYDEQRRAAIKLRARGIPAASPRRKW
jgi:hypothetical protein